MGRVISWLVMVVVAVVVILFALANSDKVALGLKPFVDYETPPLPIYLIVLAAVFVGFVAGGLTAWISGGRSRRRARTATRHLERLEAESEEMQEKIGRLETAVERDEETLRELEDEKAHKDGVAGI